MRRQAGSGNDDHEISTIIVIHDVAIGNALHCQAFLFDSYETAKHTSTHVNTNFILQRWIVTVCDTVLHV